MSLFSIPNSEKQIAREIQQSLCVLCGQKIEISKNTIGSLECRFHPGLFIEELNKWSCCKNSLLNKNLEFGCHKIEHVASREQLNRILKKPFYLSKTRPNDSCIFHKAYKNRPFFILRNTLVFDTYLSSQGFLIEKEKNKSITVNIKEEMKEFGICDANTDYSYEDIKFKDMHQKTIQKMLEESKDSIDKIPELYMKEREWNSANFRFYEHIMQKLDSSLYYDIDDADVDRYPSSYERKSKLIKKQPVHVEQREDRECNMECDIDYEYLFHQRMRDDSNDDSVVYLIKRVHRI